MADTPFRFTRLASNNVPLSEDELKDFQPYLIQKAFYYASGNEKLANIPNLLWNIPKPLQYKIFCAIFKGKRSQWMKKVRNEKDVSEIMEEYGCSRKTALEYAKILWAK